MPRAWPIDRKQELLSTSIFTVTSRRAMSPRTGRRHEFLVLEAPEWVNVVPLTADGNVVLVEQYRQGTGEVTLEIPGGMVDPGDASPADAARRELLEETGYWAETIELTGVVAPNPAIQNNLCHSFVATGLVSRGAPALDSTEDIETRVVPLAEIPSMIRDGRIRHALVVAAFWHLQAAGYRF
jgi:8-oxo-dGTP pyrophosphatase MutT (NUDIX family)